MVDLTVSAADFGPLSVDVVAVGGKDQIDKPVIISSSQPTATFHGLPAGQYAVIGTRPTGDRLVERVVLDQDPRHVQFTINGRSRHEILTQETSRGLVPPVPPDHPDDDSAASTPDPAIEGEASFSVMGSMRRAFQALSSTRLVAPAGLETTKRSYALYQWEMTPGGWKAVPAPSWHEIRPGYLQLVIDTPTITPPDAVLANPIPAAPAKAFGLLDEQGFGAMVIAPLFRDGLTITFLADGLAAEGAAERVDNPSALRVPVAVSVPGDPALADILSGLSAGALPGAEQLWVQCANKFDGVDVALDFLLHKHSDPAAAIMSAHFLSRFAPARAPVSWLRNLARLLPNVADAATLLAWRLIYGGSVDDPPESPNEIEDLLWDAIRRPCTLFARTRLLLTQASRLYVQPPSPQAALTPVPVFAPGDFLNVAADAGGLEAFWGAGPAQPGRPGRLPDRALAGKSVNLAGGKFSQ
jgi:hypothetical protein